MGDPNIHIARDGQQYGPYSEEDIRIELKSGTIKLDDLAWSEGRTDWTTLSELLGIKMPPAPPQRQSPPPAPPQRQSPPPAPVDSLSSTTFSTAPQNETLGSIALFLPVLGIVLNFLLVGNMSLSQGAGSVLTMITVTVIAGTALLIYLEAKQIGIAGRNDPRVLNGKAVTGPVGWAFSVLLLWIACFPAYMSFRSHFGLKNRLGVALLLTIAWVGSVGRINSLIEDNKTESAKVYITSGGETLQSVETTNVQPDPDKKIAFVDTQKSEQLTQTETKIIAKSTQPEPIDSSQVAVAKVKVEEESKPIPPQKLGQKFQLGGFEYTIQSVRVLTPDQTFGLVPEDNMASGDWTDGPVYFLIKYELGNVGDEASIVSLSDFLVRDASDRKFTMSAKADNKYCEVMKLEEHLPITELQPGLSISTYQIFEMPASSLYKDITIFIPKKGILSKGYVEVKIDPIRKQAVKPSPADLVTLQFNFENPEQIVRLFSNIKFPPMAKDGSFKAKIVKGDSDGFEILGENGLEYYINPGDLTKESIDLAKGTLHGNSKIPLIQQPEIEKKQESMTLKKANNVANPTPLSPVLLEYTDSAQKFNETVASFNGKLRARRAYANDESVRRSIISIANSALRQVDEQIQSIQNFIEDKETGPAHVLMSQKLQALRKLEQSIREIKSDAEDAQ